MRIGTNLIRKLNETKLSQTKFGQLVGKDQSTVSRICSNLIDVSWEETIIFANILQSMVRNEFE